MDSNCTHLDFKSINESSKCFSLQRLITYPLSCLPCSLILTKTNLFFVFKTNNNVTINDTFNSLQRTITYK